VGRKRNKAACGFHAASSSMRRERGETRWRVGSMPPHLRCPRKGMETRQRVDSTPPRVRGHGKETRGGMWFPCRLVVDAAGRRGNEAACGFHATSLGSGLLPGPGCSPCSNSPVVPFLVRLNYWLLSWSVSWQPSDWSMT
jgi:hypothetical protein